MRPAPNDRTRVLGFHLSPLNRERVGVRFTRTEISRTETLNARLRERLPAILPLPKGEGWGKGERDARQPASSKPVCKVREFMGRGKDPRQSRIRTHRKPSAFTLIELLV